MQFRGFFPRLFVLLLISPVTSTFLWQGLAQAEQVQISDDGSGISSSLYGDVALSPDISKPTSTTEAESSESSVKDRVLVSQETPNNSGKSSVTVPQSRPSLGEVNSDPMDRTVGQVTSVSQLSDVKPTDWAFTALQSLVERYGCIAGYPDRTYRGQRSMTRYEFAAGLNACLDKINEIITSGLADKVSKEDLAAVQKLQEEFAAELAALKGRVDALEAKTAQIEAQQFSTTAKLGGEVIFGLAGASGGKPPGQSRSNVIFPYLARLGVVASFTGTDILRVGLQASDFSNLGFANEASLNTRMSLLSYQADTKNNFELELLEYRFPAFDNRVVFTARPVGFSLSSVLTANSPYFDNGRGAISRFGEASPLFKIGNLDAGAGFDWLVSDRIRLQAAYGARNASSPTEGITGSGHSAFGLQLLFKPADAVLTGLSYINAYSENAQLDTGTGSRNADTSGGMNTPAKTDAISASLQWRVAPKLTFGAWGGWTFTNSITSNARANTTTYLFSLGLSDPFGREGDLLAFLFGQPPKLVDGNGVSKDTATSLHYELFYRFRVNNNISITPGLFVVTNPDHTAGNNTIWVGTVRTVFRF